MSKKNIYSFWGENPFMYKLSCIITFMGREGYLRRKAVEKLELKKGDKVLDLACGTGLNFRYIQEYVGEKGKIIGFDYSKEMLNAARERCKENGWKNVELIQGDAAEISLDYKVDGILSTLGISAIPRHKEALRKAVNLLKKESYIVVMDARPFDGLLGILNPLVKPIYRRYANWDYTKNIEKDLSDVIGKLDVKVYNLGTIYILKGKRR